MNKVSEKILSDAENRVRGIEEETERKQEQVKKDHAEEYERISALQQQELDALFNAELKRRNSLKDLEFNKDILKVKWEQLARVLENVAARLRQDDMYRRFLKTVLFKGVQTGQEEVIVSEEDRDIVNTGFLGDINLELEEKLENPPELRLSDETRATGGGLYLKEGKVEYNATIKIAIKKIFDDNELEIIDMIFPE
ncbi:MAG: hypothetical protein GY754_00640 [bacterium]|nr:hypothetical protein [bacterium]